MVQWGMPTLIELEDLQSNMDLCKQLNLDFIEINMNMPTFQPTCLNYEELNELTMKHAIYFTFHLPEDLDIGHFNKRIREANLKIIEETIDIARKVQAPIINMHMNSGIYFTLPTGKIELYDKYKEEYIKNIYESAYQIDSMLRNTNINFAIENTCIYNREFIVKAVEILLKNEKCFLTWDVGHDYSSGKKDEIFMINNIHKLKHMHMHDAIGEKNHLELYAGEMNLDYYFKYASENECRCVIETKTVEALKKSIKKLKNLQKNY